MMVSNRGSVLRLLYWQWKSVLWFTVGGVLAVVLWQFPQMRMAIPTAPLAVVGAALGIFVSFRTNSAYDRWWEGRKLWGRMINVSRHFASQVLHYLPDEADEPRRRIIRRHVAYVHALRCLLRKQDPLADDDFLRTVPDDPELYRGHSNITHGLLDQQFADLVALDEAGTLSEFRLQKIDASIFEMLAVQGGCERIKKTPMPRGYGFIAEQLIKAYGLLFPFGIVESMGVWVIPTNILVCLSFALISEAGRVLEDPFTMFWNGLPLYNMSMTIERNLGDTVGDDDLAEIPGVDERGILM